MEFDFKITRARQDYRFEMKKEHYHDYYEFYYLLHGSRRMFINDKVYRIHQGDLVCIPEGEIHRTSYLIEENKSPVECDRIAICFSREYIGSLIRQIGEEAFLTAFQKRKITIPSNRREYFEDLLFRMLDECQDIDGLSKCFCVHYCEEMLLFIIRLQRMKGMKIAKGTIDDEQILASVQYINQNYKENVTLHEMALQAGMSDSYFSKKFKQITGFGYKEYLNTVRIRNACRLLLDTNMTVTQIAGECGYMDSNYFGDAFKKVKNISPREYRKSKIM